MNSELIKNIYIPRKSILEYFKKYDIAVNSIKLRVCWDCRENLDFWEYCDQFNEDKLSSMINLWQNNRIEFYCCKCYKLKKLDCIKNKGKYVCSGRIFAII
jgi:hypothetical protein